LGRHAIVVAPGTPGQRLVPDAAASRVRKQHGKRLGEAVLGPRYLANPARPVYELFPVPQLSHELRKVLVIQATVPVHIRGEQRGDSELFLVGVSVL